MDRGIRKPAGTHDGRPVPLGELIHCRAVLPEMIARRFGRIVNMSSLHAFGEVPFAAHYSAAKAGIAGLTKALAVGGELMP